MKKATSVKAFPLDTSPEDGAKERRNASSGFRLKCDKCVNSVLPISWCFNKGYIMAHGGENIKIIAV